MTSLAEELSRLTNTAPTWADPEDITDGAKLLQKPGKDNDQDEGVTEPGKLRKRAAHFLDEDDQRYHGKKISRKSLGEGDEEEKVPELFEDESDEEENAEDEESDSVDEDRLQESYTDNSGHQDDGESVSDEEDSDEDEDDDDEEDDMSDGEGHTSFVDFNNSQSQIESEESDEETSTIKKLSATPQEQQKGQAVRNQLSLWESLLKTRIELQKITSKANQMPQPDMWQGFAGIGGQEYNEATQQAKSSLYKVLEQLVNLQTMLLAQNKNTASLSSKGSGTPQKGKEQVDDDDEEIPSDSDAKKKKVPTATLR